MSDSVDVEKALADGYVDVSLSRPVEMAGAQVTVLRLREPKVSDQLAMDGVKGGSGMQEVVLLANLCEVTPDDIKALTMRDYKRLQKAFLAFID